MQVVYECLYCGKENVADGNFEDEYEICCFCGGVHDIHINDEGEVIVEEF